MIYAHHVPQHAAYSGPALPAAIPGGRAGPRPLLHSRYTEPARVLGGVRGLARRVRKVGAFAAASAYGAAQESNLPSDGLRRLTGFEDRLGHRARAAPPPTVAP